ncbi:hypothetical protein HF324_26585 [Chitinophaga oryzae]|uniref:Beta-lactamase-inhibitor-like PepSY-like domain-containing protein n=1 Tax=Chitinophaga oryzae TaxID=2725414 RepID=A0AAE7D9W8_9BACT|nr:hypothetical protein [Chitinophaga oryzae]QJB34697.1 hypothetical protein HF329_26715 [Chitinophaga oryzae]QJB41214.1 hypothetical protein HF324_26585 [Chitinophaga oryzae]
MKKLILLMSAALLLSASALFANTYETTVNSRIQHSFSETFAGASEVKWYTDDNKTFTAKFNMSSSKVTAFFDDAGNLLATSRYLDPEQLPLALTSRLNKRYPNDSLYCIVEYSSNGNVVYFITLEGKDTWTVLKADGTGATSVKSRLKKA